jgi:hypothetical protein
MKMTIHAKVTPSNVVKIQRPTHSKKARKPRPRRTTPSHIIAATGILAVGLVLVGLSLSHLAEGVQVVTGSGAATAWPMAAGIDLGFVALEIALLISPDDLRPAVSRYASPAIAGTLAISAAMNALAFASHAQGSMIFPAIGLGCAIPALTKTGATLAFHKQ